MPQRSQGQSAAPLAPSSISAPSLFESPLDSLQRATRVGM